LEHLDKQFSDDTAHVDIGVFNAARIATAWGTPKRKGFNTPDQPHRLSKIEAIPAADRVTPEQLTAIIGPYPGEQLAPSGNGQPHWDIPQLLDEQGISHTVGEFDCDGQKGTKYIFAICPFDAAHDNQSAGIFQLPNGAVAFKCHHNGCADKTWESLKKLWGLDIDVSQIKLPTPQQPAPQQQQEQTGLPGVRRPGYITMVHLRKIYAARRPPIIDGLLREGETMNVISSSKVGKTWLAQSLVVCAAAGVPWLGIFQVGPIPVYLFDNELFGDDIHYRIDEIAQALGIPRALYDNNLHFEVLRGQDVFLPEILEMWRQIHQDHPGRFKLLGIDALYRSLQVGMNESDNNAFTSVYNAIDRINTQNKAAAYLVHHASKGNQSAKAVTDVGSGAGAISRAADTHLIFRDHQLENCVVLEARMRSFPPLAPLTLSAVPAVGATGGRGARRAPGRTANKLQQDASDADGKEQIRKALRTGGKTRRQLPMGDQRKTRILSQLVDNGEVVVVGTVRSGGHDCEVYGLASTGDGNGQNS